jgi:hypothetical protein
MRRGRAIRQGFETETYFSLDGGDKSQMRRASVRHGSEPLLNMSYLPAARLIQLSRKDRREKEIGYRIGMESGLWNPRDDGPDPEEWAAISRTDSQRSFINKKVRVPRFKSVFRWGN